MNEHKSNQFLFHGSSDLPSVVIDGYNIGLRDKDGFVGDKATGLAAALHRLGLLPRNVVGVGDAENDHAFIKICGCTVAVANAIPALIKEADIVTDGARGAGVAELIDRMIATDLQDVVALYERARLAG